MAVAYDTTSTRSVTTGDQSWTHSGSASCAGALVLIVEEGGTDTITGVTYGGQAMDEVSGSPLLYTTPETGSIHGFFLNNPPKGEVQVAVDTATGSDQWIGACFTVTSTTGQSEIHDTSTMAGAAAQTTVGATLTITKTSFVAGAMYSGLGAPAFTEVSGTAEIVEGDLGQDSGGISRGDSLKTGDFAYTWSQASDDGMALVVAISQKEAVSATAQAAAAGTGAAYTSGKTVAGAAGAGAATGAAYQAAGQPGKPAPAGLSAGTAAVYGTTAKVTANAGVATATGAAAAPTAPLTVRPGAGAATGAALDATAETEAGAINFTCEAAATGTALALAVNANLKASAGYAKARSA